jgi:hypothetical protein
MLNTPEMRHLQAVIVLAEELNFTRAAQILRIGQPALSKQITEVEGLHHDFLPVASSFVGRERSIFRGHLVPARASGAQRRGSSA